MLSALDAHFGTHAFFDSAKLVVARDGNCAVWFRGDGVDLGTVDACTDTDSDDVDIWLTGTFAAGEGGNTGGDTRDVLSWPSVITTTQDSVAGLHAKSPLWKSSATDWIAPPISVPPALKLEDCKSMITELWSEEKSKTWV